MSKPGGNAGWLDRLSGLLHRVGAVGQPHHALAGSAESSFGKRALKETIERKRKNDQARREELDRLRQLRRQGPAVEPDAADTAAAACFHSSVMPYPDAQSLTIRKIDAIEAQMSRHWWKGRVGGGKVDMRPLPLPVTPSTTPDTATRDLAYASTRLSTRSPGADAWEATGFEATQLAIAMVDPLSPADAWRPPEVDSRASEFMASGLLSIEPSVPTPDIEMEQAALRFANGDLAGAQLALQTALLAAPTGSETAPRWAAALLDLGRTTGQRALFDATASEYGRYFERGVPGWFSVPDALAPLASLTPLTPLAPPTPQGAAVLAPASSAVSSWRSPSLLAPDAVAELRASLLPGVSPWRLDWSELEIISVEAVTDLQALFALWCAEPVALQFVSAERLEQALRQLTASGDPALPMSCWLLRLDALRLLLQRDEFELTALDFCVTHETAPPLWVAPLCRLVPAAASAPPPLPSRAASPQPPSGAGGPALALALRGELRGDMPATLAELQRPMPTAVLVVVSCTQLVRVDFSAAGTLLTWTMAHQQAGGTVRFDDVPHLVAAFFHVIGINEHAEVVLRTR
jgi:ABC-type transporter Mla MlaB component